VSFPPPSLPPWAVTPSCQTSAHQTLLCIPRNIHSLSWVHVVHNCTSEQPFGTLLNLSQQRKVRIAASEPASVSILSWPEPSGVLMCLWCVPAGSQGRDGGVHRDGRRATLQRPMLGMVESFNISVATAVVLHHVTRDRTARKARPSPHLTLTEPKLKHKKEKKT